MTKKIGKAWLPDWVSLILLWVIFIIPFIICALIAGVGLQIVCFILQPSTIVPSLKEAWEALIDIIHDQRN